ncbi:MAG: cadherin-like domain-containing protein, partial [Psychrosphaera sp.]|nr:cadherin-like domain-containing protein [Psychrosphaera sp.]
MNKIKLISQLLAITTLCIGITACGGGGGDSTPTPTPTPTPTVNNPPTVSAGNSQSIDEQSLVTLTANASDSDGSIAAYQWTQITGDILNLSGSDSANASFTAPTVLAQHGPQTFTFQAQATDDDGDSATDTVVITVNPVNSAPIVDAGSTQIVNEGSLVQLTGTATDDDGSLESIL